VAVTKVGAYDAEGQVSFTTYRDQILLDIVCIEGCTDLYSYNKRMKFEVESSELDLSEETIEWTVSPSQLTFSTNGTVLQLLDNSKNSQLNSILQNSELDIEVSTDNAAGSLTKVFNQKPNSGSISISPASGKALSTLFTITISGFEDEDMEEGNSLKYTFSFQTQENSSEFEILASKISNTTYKT